jgi:GTP-binding protein Era
VIQALVFVERDSQKAIVIGRGGARIKAIGSAARRQMEKLLGSRVYLELKVKTAPDWSNTRSGLRRTGQLL